MYKYKHINKYSFNQGLKLALSNTDIQSYKEFEVIFMNILDHHSPFKKEIFRTNNTPNIIKKIRKVIKDLILNKFIRKLSQNIL